MKLNNFKIILLIILVAFTLQRIKKATSKAKTGKSKAKNEVKMLVLGDNGQIRHYYETTGTKTQTEQDAYIKDETLEFANDDNNFSCATTVKGTKVNLSESTKPGYLGMLNFQRVLKALGSQLSQFHDITILGDIIYPENKFNTRKFNLVTDKKNQEENLANKVVNINFIDCEKKYATNSYYQTLLRSSCNDKKTYFTSMLAADGDDADTKEKKGVVVIPEIYYPKWSERVLCGFEILFALLSDSNLITPKNDSSSARYYKQNFFLLGGNHSFDVSGSIESKGAGGETDANNKRIVTKDTATHTEDGLSTPESKSLKTFNQVYDNPDTSLVIEYFDTTKEDEEQDGKYSDAFLLKPRLISHLDDGSNKIFAQTLDINSSIYACVVYAQYNGDEPKWSAKYYECLNKRFVSPFATVSYVVAVEYVRRTFAALDKMDSASTWNIVRSHHTPTNAEDCDEDFYFKKMKHWEFKKDATEFKYVDRADTFMETLQKKNVGIWLASHNHSSSFMIWKYGTEYKPYSCEDKNVREIQKRIESGVDKAEKLSVIYKNEKKLELNDKTKALGPFTLSYLDFTAEPKRVFENKRIETDDSFTFNGYIVPSKVTHLHIFITGSSGRYFDSINNDALTNGSLIWGRSNGDYSANKAEPKSYNYAYSTLSLTDTEANVEYYEVKDDDTPRNIAKLKITRAETPELKAIYDKIDARKVAQEIENANVKSHVTKGGFLDKTYTEVSTAVAAKKKKLLKKK